jgi:hypothetical protein
MSQTHLPSTEPHPLPSSSEMQVSLPPFPSPPPFKPSIPLQLWNWRIEDPLSPSGTSHPNPFPVHPTTYKRYWESYRSPPHSFPRVLPKWRLPAVAVHLCLTTDSATPPPRVIETVSTASPPSISLMCHVYLLWPVAAAHQASVRRTAVNGLSVHGGPVD